MLANSNCISHVLAGMLLHAFGVSLAIVIPAMAAGLRLLFTKNAMNWFSHPYLAFFMFVPASLFGLLLPRFIWVLSEQSHFWGAFGLYSLITLVSSTINFHLDIIVLNTQLLSYFLKMILNNLWPTPFVSIYALASALFSEDDY
jgi:predicted transglutaminase-like protease